MNRGVWVNDEEWSDWCQGVTVEWSVKEATTAKLSLLVDDLDIDAESLAVLEAHVKEKVAA